MFGMQFLVFNLWVRSLCLSVRVLEGECLVMQGVMFPVAWVASTASSGPGATSFQH